MGYRTCYLCKYWSEDDGWCSKNNAKKSRSDWCSSIDLIPCCASCEHWTRNDDYIDQGNCAIYKGLSPATSICKADHYKPKYGGSSSSGSSYSSSYSGGSSYSGSSSGGSSKSGPGCFIVLAVIAAIVLGAIFIPKFFDSKSSSSETTASTAVAASTDPADYSVPERDLYKGTNGEDVKWLQAALIKLGYSVKVDGDFGNETENAVKQFQTDQGLGADGSVGPITLARLKELIG